MPGCVTTVYNVDVQKWNCKFCVTLKPNLKLDLLKMDFSVVSIVIVSLILCLL